jgi:Tfp pilus assembly protein PilF
MAPGQARRASSAGVLLVSLLAAALTGCATPPAPPPPPAPPGLTDLLERPAERALYDGIRAYDDGQYAQAETQLRRALDSGLRSPRDRASAYKLLAFITCTSGRSAECEAHFRAARAADPAFQLNRSEAGHPVWGPVYRRAVPQ